MAVNPLLKQRKRRKPRLSDRSRRGGRATRVAAPTAREAQDPGSALYDEIDRRVQRYRANLRIDFNGASPIQVLAWCLAQPLLRDRHNNGRA